MKVKTVINLSAQLIEYENINEDDFTEMRSMMDKVQNEAQHIVTEALSKVLSKNGFVNINSCELIMEEVCE